MAGRKTWPRPGSMASKVGMARCEPVLNVTDEAVIGYHFDLEEECLKNGIDHKLIRGSKWILEGLAQEQTGNTPGRDKDPGKGPLMEAIARLKSQHHGKLQDVPLRVIWEELVIKLGMIERIKELNGLARSCRQNTACGPKTQADFVVAAPGFAKETVLSEAGYTEVRGIDAAKKAVGKQRVHYYKITLVCQHSKEGTQDQWKSASTDFYDSSRGANSSVCRTATAIRTTKDVDGKASSNHSVRAGQDAMDLFAEDAKVGKAPQKHVKVMYV